jgi:uncharacterized protein YPO0396
MGETLHEAKALARLDAISRPASPDPGRRKKQVVDETPKPEQSQHAADHVEGVMDAVDAVFGEVKQAAAEAIAKLRGEAEQMKSNMQLFDERVTGRMRHANARFRNFIGGNGGPLLEGDTKVIEYKPE